MPFGAYHKEPYNQFGPIYTSPRSSMRRRPLILAGLAVFLLCVYYIRKDAGQMVASHTPSQWTTPSFSSSDEGKSVGGKVKGVFEDEFPKKIWQTGSEEMRVKWEEKTDTWKNLNPEWEYELLTDDSNTLFVEDRFSDRPALLAFWQDLNVTILRADMIRYLALLADGGVYSDMDTSCITPIDEWIPSSFQNVSSSINAIVGIEYDDTSYKMFVRPISMCQWTLMAKPGHPIFEAVVARVIYHLEYLARIQNTNLSGLKIGKKEVLEATGPGAFTDAVMETLSNNMGRRVLWSEVQNVKEAKLFGDVLVLPINGFGSGQKHSHSSDKSYGEVLAKHHFGRSWYVHNPAPVPAVVPAAVVEEKEKAIIPTEENAVEVAESTKEVEPAEHEQAEAAIVKRE